MSDPNALAVLDTMNEQGRVSYEVYSELHDAVSLDLEATARAERDYLIARIDHYLSIMDLPRDRLARRALRRLRQDLEKP